MAKNSSSFSALEQLRALIRQHPTPELPLPTERELAERYQVGRREIRRALDVLEMEGRVWRKQGKGTFLGPDAPAQPLLLQSLPRQSNPLEVMEARLQLEPGLARLAAVRASGEQLALMSRLQERMQAIETDDGDQHELWDSAFHRTLAEAAGNRLLLGLFDALDAVRRDSSWRHVREMARNPARLGNYDRHHQRLIGHLQARQPEAAAAVMTEHLLALQQALVDVLPANEEPRS
ncbi:FCD domain-containing protein [Sodalis sp. dw_96]|uniref:FadR/GntR family transcriptional regulator n=1 Tax=Sodalis sp. dw_96 TaxID=2719794 RepID=UPI001BD2E84A|nr:FCD domain-containing protein [Sodalis sp. dw_96]